MPVNCPLNGIYFHSVIFSLTPLLFGCHTCKQKRRKPMGDFMKIYLLIPFVAGLAACTSMDHKLPSISDTLRETTGQNGRACVRTSDIRGYGVQGDVINIDSDTDYYIATVHPGCLDLQTSMGIMFSGGFSEICGGRIDKIITRDNECSINHIFQFKNRDAAFEAYEKATTRREELRSNEQR